MKLNFRSPSYELHLANMPVSGLQFSSLSLKEEIRLLKSHICKVLFKSANNMIFQGQCTVLPVL